jgi:hypothetical protein
VVLYIEPDGDTAVSVATAAGGDGDRKALAEAVAALLEAMAAAAAQLLEQYGLSAGSSNVTICRIYCHTALLSSVRTTGQCFRMAAGPLQAAVCVETTEAAQPIALHVVAAAAPSF